jgi:nicotinamidase-related amidase
MKTDNAVVIALIVVDVQRAFDEWEAAGKRRNNPDAVARIADLLRAFRQRRLPVFHIRHEGTKPDSSFLPDRTGYAVKEEARELLGEHRSLSNG